MHSHLSTLPEVAAYLRRRKNVAPVPLPSIVDLPMELREIAEALPQITGTWNPVEIYTADPKSLREEKQKFFSAMRVGRVYNPVFTYEYAESLSVDKSKKKLEAMLEEVRTCKPSDRGGKLMRLLFFYKIKDDLATCTLVEGIQEKDETKIASALQYKYPGVDPLIQAFAEEDLQRRTREGTKLENGSAGELTADERQYLRTTTFDAPAIKEAFEWALNEYGILKKGTEGRGFSVVIDRRATAIDVRDKSVKGSTVFIPESSRETAERLLGLIAHEIEGHARQSWNGEKLFMFGGGPLKIDEETLYEGLAMRYENAFRERYFGSEYARRNLDYYVFAVRFAESGGSFYDIFKDQFEKRLRVALGIPAHAEFSPSQVHGSELERQAMESAWGTTYRVMRGHLNTKNPLHFAMAKDLAYFRGWLLDQQLHQSGHGHVNEATIFSIGQLRVLAEFDLSAHHLPSPYKDVTSVYLKKLLAKRAPGIGGTFQVKKR